MISRSSRARPAPRRRRAVLSLVAAAALGACSSTSTQVTDQCFVRVIAITTRTPKVTAGDSLVIPATVVPQCLPPGNTPSNLRWSSTDTTVLTVDTLPRLVTADSLTGTAHALRAGTAGVVLSIPGVVDPRDSIGVTVLAAP